MGHKGLYFSLWTGKGATGPYFQREKNKVVFFSPGRGREAAMPVVVLFLTGEWKGINMAIFCHSGGTDEATVTFSITGEE